MSGQDIVPIETRTQALQTIRRNEAKVARGFWGKLKRSVGRVPFLEEAVSAYYCAFDPKTPRRVKALLLAALAYFVVPSDMIPDFVAGLGFSDDATVLFATIRMVSGHIGERHHLAARRRLAELGLRDAAAAEAADRPAQGV